MTLTRRERRALRHHVPDQGRIDQLTDAYRAPWVESRFEFDRQLLALSTAGVGLLVGIASAHAPAHAVVRLMMAVALTAFATTVLVTLRAVWLNSRFLEIESRLATSDDERDEAEHERLAVRLRSLSKVSIRAFAIGVATTALVGGAALSNHW